MPEATTETTVELNGVRLYTRRVGHGPPVVVLHGGPGAHHDYLLPQYDHLTEGGRALLYYDQRGGGRSPVPRDVPVGWREHVADLEALRRHWELDRLTLVGYSWGGLLAVLYALEHPDRIARLALVSTAPVSAAWRDEFERRFAARMAQPWIARGRAAVVDRSDRAGDGTCPARGGHGGLRARAGRFPAEGLRRLDGWTVGKWEGDLPTFQPSTVLFTFPAWTSKPSAIPSSSSPR